MVLPGYNSIITIFFSAVVQPVENFPFPGMTAIHYFGGEYGKVIREVVIVQLFLNLHATERYSLHLQISTVKTICKVNHVH